LWSYREVLLNLVRKELKVKYTGSVLGAVWSLVNPVVFLAVFSFVAAVLGGAAKDYPIFLLAGLLPWNLFSVSLSGGAVSVIMNANLVKKVYFPREILPLATIGVALVDFVLQSAVFLAYIVLRAALFPGYALVLNTIWLYPIAFVALLLFTVAVAFWISSVNVRYRDLTHLIGLALLVWFWLTPIVYAIGRVHSTIEAHPHAPWWFWDVYLLNPMTWVVSGFQTALYHAGDAGDVLIPLSAGGLALGLCVVALASGLLLYGTWRVFFALSGDFAEEL
jgi:ABC-2 type transport system permease protein